MKSHIFLSISILILNSDIKLSIDFFNVGFDDLSKYNGLISSTIKKYNPYYDIKKIKSGDYIKVKKHIM